MVTAGGSLTELTLRSFAKRCWFRWAGLRADAGGGTLGGRRRTASGRRDPAALDESGRTLAPPASAKAVSPAQDAQAAFRRTGAVGCQLSSLAGRSRRQRLSHAHGR